jgi:hypothetical protein
MPILSCKLPLVAESLRLRFGPDHKAENYNLQMAHNAPFQDFANILRDLRNKKNKDTKHVLAEVKAILNATPSGPRG